MLGTIARTNNTAGQLISVKKETCCTFFYSDRDQLGLETADHAEFGKVNPYTACIHYIH